MRNGRGLQHSLTQHPHFTKETTETPWRSSPHCPLPYPVSLPSKTSSEDGDAKKRTEGRARFLAGLGVQKGNALLPALDLLRGDPRAQAGLGNDDSSPGSLGLGFLNPHAWSLEGSGDSLPPSTSQVAKSPRRRKSWEESHMGGEAGRSETNFRKSGRGFLQHKRKGPTATTEAKTSGIAAQEAILWPDGQPEGQLGWWGRRFKFSS